MESKSWKTELVIMIIIYSDSLLVLNKSQTASVVGFVVFCCRNVLDLFSV